MNFTSGAWLCVLVALSAPAAFSQSPRSYSGEIVMTEAGELVAPWKEAKVCGGKADACRMVVFNPVTKEAARLDGRWSTRFEATGKGKEVRRAEPAMAKAVRLKGPAKK